MGKYIKEIKIHGISTEAEVFVDANGREWVRFAAEGCWAPQVIGKSDAHVLVHINEDKSIRASTQQLIFLEKVSDERWLRDQMKRMLNSIESSLGLGSLVISSNWVGHSSVQLDWLMREFERAIVAEKTVQVLMEFNALANICGYFYNHCRTPELCDHETVNNGYNCKHSAQEEGEDGIGSCYAWSCPFCYPTDGSVCSIYGIERKKDEKGGCERDDDYVVASVPEKLLEIAI